jgi:hypothetical protein
MESITEAGIHNALCQQLIEHGMDAAETDEKAARMINSWDWFTDNAVDDCGVATGRDWVERQWGPEIVRLLDKTLELKYARPHTHRT